MPTSECLPPLHRNTQPLSPPLLLLLLLCIGNAAALNVTASAVHSLAAPATSIKSSSVLSVASSAASQASTGSASAPSAAPPSAAPPTTSQPCLPTNASAADADGNETQPWRGPEYDVVSDPIVNGSVIRSNNGLLNLKNATFSAFILETNSPLDEENETVHEEVLGVSSWTATDVCLIILKAVVMVGIITVSVLGNVLVIVSVALHRRLHSTANYLLVSLATADMLVALCAMTFNASVELSGGRWIFGRIMCDLWNSFDVYFSTVSILHLCCISVDRYYAIVRPLEYPLTITRRILAIMLAHCWLAPTLISFLPIFLGWYTTATHLQERDSEPYVCAFVVNAIFALVSSAVSFWVPCTVMVVMYYRIFQEARKQERALLSRASSASSAAYSTSIRLSTASQQQQQQDIAAAAMARQQLLVALQATPFTPATRHQEFLMKTLSDTSSTASVTTTSSGVPSTGPSGSSSSRSSSGGGGLMVSGYAAGANNSVKASTSNGSNSGTGWRHSRQGSTASWHGPSRHGSLVPCGRRMHSTPVVTTKPGPPPVGRREHKAARTLGLIMGAFVLCWLPFFTWYVSINICGSACRCPHAVVTALFWIGYFNSTLNPFIYAYFRADFREAFHRTLKRLTCCRPRQPSGVFV
ncbi:octopamine receptor beta-3R-like [Penaeus japonicus]|uniref:octopamine receptor beta-3R-like n=1 Tax=Penaeus japonicus TaxID=27405 RepID=UPI001C710D96|nr:octopamine receptor beta-3R-like [Penaeus japonicus]XP_042877488.1 octopamine receptor beta-3R-like [Penaeus japonicus]XP_042877489.1 octopamine receptor beta-3R-like [Penaeus japonicus]